MELRPLIARPAVVLRNTDGRHVTTCG